MSGTMVELEPALSCEGLFEELGIGLPDGRSLRLGLMGGTFDPLHVGHIACAQAAYEACGLDAVAFVPAGDPHFKQGRTLASGEQRLAWCQEALAGFPHFAAGGIEVHREGVTYTVDTLREIHAELEAKGAGGVELFFIMGSDSAASLPRWREASSLAKLARYVAVSRPGQSLGEDLRAQLAEAGFAVDYVETLCCDVSSTDIRARLAVGESVAGLVPEVIRMSVERCPVYCGGARDALSQEFFDARLEELKPRVSEKRLLHVMGVVKAAEELAHAYGVDVAKARLAALLHDWDKGYGDEEMRARVAELGMLENVDPWVLERMPYVLHGQTAACALAREFPQIPHDVIAAVDKHTVAAEEMSDLDKVLYIADAIEEGRKFGRIDELRSEVGKVDLDRLFFLTYEYWTLLLFERRRQLHPDTIRIWNELVAREAAEKKLAARMAAGKEE